MTTLQTHELIDTAADLIETLGWTQGPDGWPSTPDHDGPVCAEGGLMLAGGINWATGPGELVAFWQSPAVTAVKNQIGATFIPEWNDEEGRTRGEVIGALRSAAAVERQRAGDLAELDTLATGELVSA